jgi:abortive infection bacteriophage resistance protein
MSYTKPYLSLPDQLALLKSRGLQVADDTVGMECLRRNGYYRLSAYWYPFREIVSGLRTDNFLTGSSFEDVVSLYTFDKKFKLLLLDALERVEIAARVEIALTLGQRNTFAQEDPLEFHTNFTTRRRVTVPSGYDTWLRNYKKQVDKSKDEFMLHFERQHSSRYPLPIWIAIELWDFGLLSNAFGGLKYPDQVTIATRFSVPDRLLMQSWLHCLNYVRNVIAHHGRLWNLNLSVNPRLPKPGVISDFDDLTLLHLPGTRIYSVCCILAYLTRIINPNSPWITEMKDLIKSFPVTPHVSVQDMGFPSDWETHGFWL